MKITAVEMLHADAGWRPWSFVKIETDGGIVGWSECTDSHGSPRGMEGVVRDMAPLIVGRDPEDLDRLLWEMHARTKQSPGSILQKALGGIENALWDIVGKSKGVPVYKLFDGPVRKELPLYWSHCGTSRVRAWDAIKKPRIKTRDDVIAFGKEVRDSGFKAIKTNIGILGDEPYVYMPGFFKSPGDRDGHVSAGILSGIEAWVSALREAVGKDVAIALDLNFNFNAGACITIGKTLEQYNLAWFEIDLYDPKALRTVRDAIQTPITSCENILGLSNYRPYFDAGSMDVTSVDIIWNGFRESVEIAKEAGTRGMEVVPHNYNGHLSTMISAHWAAVLENVKIMEYDVDDVPWRDSLFTDIPAVSNGVMTLNDKPGWGCDVREDVLKEHPWPKS